MSVTYNDYVAQLRCGTYLPKIKIEFFLPMGAAASGLNTIALFQDSTANAIATFPATIDAGSTLNVKVGSFIVTSGSTTARTYKLRAGPPSGTSYVNSYNGSAFFGGTMQAVMIVTEII
jgi:hypothetical protein